MTDVIVVGALGRMGSLLARTVAAQDDLRLVAAVDTRPRGTTPVRDVPLFTSVEAALALTGADAAVDFTTPAAVAGNVRALLNGGIDTIVGTSGLAPAALGELGELAEQNGRRLLVVPNFALGAVLMMDFAQRAAAVMPAAEIVELHHDDKPDAPSATALRTAQLIAGARRDVGQAAPVVPSDEAGLPARGHVEEGVHVHSVRLPGLVAHQEVVFGGAGETLSIRHDSLTRDSFMTGCLLAIRRLERVQGTVVGLENLL